MDAEASSAARDEAMEGRSAGAHGTLEVVALGLRQDPLEAREAVLCHPSQRERLLRRVPWKMVLPSSSPSWLPWAETALEW